MNLLHFASHLTALAILSQPVESQDILQPPVPPYADLADLALPAPLVAHVEVRKASRLKERDSASAPPGHRRFLVEADIIALIRGPGGLPRRVSYLVDLPDDALGRPSRIPRRAHYIIMAAHNPAEPGELRLIAPDAHIPFTPASADRIRALLQEASRADSPAPVTGIGQAFHIPGSLPGESETQIFLQRADNRPISLNVLRRPGEPPRWSVALGEIVDQAAAPPEPETLLWYRLACFLPPALPAQSVRNAAPDEARAIRADYRLILERLGPCVRNRPNR